MADNPEYKHSLDAQIRARSIRKYSHRATGYDSTCRPTWPARLATIDKLQLLPGQHVLDVGCGTGLSLELLHRAVGDTGLVSGVEQSPQMIALARQKVQTAGWRNVMLYEAAAQGFNLRVPIDAFLFHYTHDILRSDAALDSLVQLAKPGARIAIAGIKYFPWWMAPLNLWVYFKNVGYNGSPGELYTPWDKISPRIADWEMSSTQWGMGYIASGRLLHEPVKKFL